MTKTFDFGYGPVPAHRHKNPDGSEGGWVAETAQVSGNARVSGNAWVYGNAQVFGNARVFGDAYASGQWINYAWDSWTDKDAARWLRYGCELHLLSDWTETKIGDLVAVHEPRSVDKYVRGLAALVALCSTLPNDVAPSKEPPAASGGRDGGV